MDSRSMQGWSSEVDVRERIFDMLAGLHLANAWKRSCRKTKVLLRVNVTPVARGMHRASGVREGRAEHRTGGDEQGDREGSAAGTDHCESPSVTASRVIDVLAASREGRPRYGSNPTR